MAKELGLSEDHQDVQRVFLAVYKSFMEVLIADTPSRRHYENTLSWIPSGVKRNEGV